MITSHYVFKILDFLVQNEFISQEHYRSIFQDNNMLEEVVYFVSKVYTGNIMDGFTIYTHDFQEYTETYTPNMAYLSGNLFSFHSLLRTNNDYQRFKLE
jgi:hypothetical protein